MKTRISESIYHNKNVLIPMADVQHIEYLANGIFVVMKSTLYDFEHDVWNNPVFIDKDNQKEFVKAYCYYRYEKDVKEAIDHA